MRTQDPHVWSEVGNKSLAAIELCEELGSNEAAWEKEIISLDGRWLQKTDIRGFLVALTDSIRTYAEPFGLPEVAKRWAAELNVDPGSSPDKLPN